MNGWTKFRIHWQIRGHWSISVHIVTLLGAKFKISKLRNLIGRFFLEFFYKFSFFKIQHQINFLKINCFRDLEIWKTLVSKLNCFPKNRQKINLRIFSFTLSWIAAMWMAVLPIVSFCVISNFRNSLSNFITLPDFAAWCSFGNLIFDWSNSPDLFEYKDNWEPPAEGPEFLYFVLRKNKKKIFRSFRIRHFQLLNLAPKNSYQVMACEPHFLSIYRDQ